MRNILLRWSTNLFASPFYIQVYSKNTSITRIFVYMNKATIECFSDHINASDTVLFGIEVLNCFFKRIPQPDQFTNAKKCATFYALSRIIID